MQLIAHTEPASLAHPEGHGLITRELRARSLRGDIVVQVVGSEPAWLSPVLSRLAVLLELPENWDSYGALQINPTLVVRGIELLGETLTEKTPAPQVTPTSTGSVQFEWHLAHGHLEVQILPGDQFTLYFEDFDDGKEREEESTNDIQRLRTAVAELFHLAARS